MAEVTLSLPRPHVAQRRIIREARRFNVVCCGRRWGKSTLAINRLVRPPLEGKPVAYFAPIYKMMAEVWRDVAHILAPVTLRTNAQEHRLELVTGGVVDMWSLDSPDVARGRKYARVIVDEAAQIVGLQGAWEQVIRSTLADYGGDAWFFSTPRGFNYFHSLFGQGQSATLPDWASWQMPTHTNPFIAPTELAAMELELPGRVYNQEILALFEQEQEGALWLRQTIDDNRIWDAPKTFKRICVAVDPSASSTGAETGIVVAALGHDGHGYVLADRSVRGSPDTWATAAVRAYADYGGDVLVAEANNGGEMVRQTIKTAPGAPPVKLVHASRGKQTRAEPIARLYEQGKIHHLGGFPLLEQQMCSWVPGDESPDRLDALVWALTTLLISQTAMSWA